MKLNQKQFIARALELEALKFGSFTLKSGRASSYFFNMAMFTHGKDLNLIGDMIADMIDATIDIDTEEPIEVIFGPAYKGIPIATATVTNLDNYGYDTELAFNRKEPKAHGEGGSLVGASIKGKRVVIVDDLITAGTAIREAISLVTEAGGEVVLIAVVMDRQEVGCKDGVDLKTSAVQDVAEEAGCPVVAALNLDSLMKYVEQGDKFQEHLPAMQEYRKKYGVK